MKNINFIDLFAGIGGIRLAFEDEHTNCVFSSEWDKFSQKTYEANFGEIPHGDITDINAYDIPEHDILLAGFPCQPFSKIGRREGFKNATQGTLFFDILRILEFHKPKAFLLENVTGLLQNDNGRTIKIIIKSLEEQGYNVQIKVYNSADFGLPQNRRRVYIVGFSNELKIDFKFPKEPNIFKPISSVLEKNVEGYEISERLQQSYLFKKDDGKPQIVDSNSNIQANTLVATYHKIQRITGTFVRDGQTGLRLLTKNECLQMQGFPLDFKIPVSRTQMYRQLGNTVSVPVVQAIANEMKKCIRGVEACHQMKLEV
ncbi:DNA (cytosine-5-)-methyltransferase [Staphylococcus pettenkoferi]|uniref:Cytosine-specific methyltransferase n=1 Tax=Staphylococcus pettenkoferi TaxID=170573 RepID=A0A2N6QLI1_9STAP|nr:DNA cytosine methyltransferase [Staphylococcus pettenkoferi]PMC20524.1 DNA (cytosine-5-)-methyltransferase [Staphylococcus pettenkoferi]